jgi:hypothetical protein
MISTIDLPNEGGAPKEMLVTFRVPEGRSLASISTDGQRIPFTGRNQDAALITSKGRRRFEVVADLR